MVSHASADEEQARLFVALRRLVRFLRTTDAPGKGPSLSPAQQFVLSKLESGAPASIRDLAARTLTDASSVSVVVTKLVARGLVARRTDPDDRRCAAVVLTAAGRRAVNGRAISPPERIASAFGSMAPAQRASIVEALESLLAAVGAESLPPTMFFEDAPRRASARPAARGGRRGDA
jgi:DNA-binding MarR family transcriptional regulator